MIGTVLALPFLGFAFTIAIGSPLLDYIGMRLLLPLSGICFSLGMLTFIFADKLASGAANLYGALDGRADNRHRLGAGRDCRQSADCHTVSR